MSVFASPLEAEKMHTPPVQSPPEVQTGKNSFNNRKKWETREMSREQIVTHDCFGVPVDFRIKSSYSGGVVTQTVEAVIPAMSFGADGVLRVW